MDPKARIRAILNGETVDRLPVDIWHTPEIYELLRKHCGVQTDRELYRELGLDKLYWVFMDYEDKGAQVGANAGEGQERTMWGAPIKAQQAGEAMYQEFGEAPLGAYPDVASLEDYPFWPDPAKFQYEKSLKVAREVSQEYAVLGPWVSFFEIYCQLRGLEQSLMDLMLDPDYVNAVLDRVEAIQTAMLERYLSEAGDAVDLIFISDDMGAQKSLLISLDSWDTYFKERMRRWCDLIHGHGKKVFYHSDGAMEELVPRLIEVGVDVLNPIQHVCPGMEMEKLKDKYGRDLIFHGGVDNQGALPFGSVEDVKKETRHCLDTLGRDGSGYICCSCHNIQPGTPVENILAMIETVQAG